MRNTLLLISCGLLLSGCEQLGIETPAQINAAKEAEGRAVGSACRHSGRALEDCYTLNPKAVKAAVFTGWRDMDAYMRENSIEVVPAVVPRPDANAKKKKPAAEEPTADHGAKQEEAPAKKEESKAVHSEADLPKPVRGGKIA